jgi:hypothetical protein
MEYDLPIVGARYKKGCQVKHVIDIMFKKEGHPDIIYLVPGKNRMSGQWYPLWADWVRDATRLE